MAWWAAGCSLASTSRTARGHEPRRRGCRSRVNGAGPPPSRDECFARIAIAHGCPAVARRGTRSVTEAARNRIGGPDPEIRQLRGRRPRRGWVAVKNLVRRPCFPTTTGTPRPSPRNHSAARLSCDERSLGCEQTGPATRLSERASGPAFERSRKPTEGPRRNRAALPNTEARIRRLSIEERPRTASRLSRLPGSLSRGGFGAANCRGAEAAAGAGVSTAARGTCVARANAIQRAGWHTRTSTPSLSLWPKPRRNWNTRPAAAR